MCIRDRDLELEAASVSAMSPEQQAQALSSMPVAKRHALLSLMHPEQQSHALAAMAPDERAVSLAAMDPPQRYEVLAAMPPGEVSVRELDDAVREAERVAEKLRGAGKQEEAASTEEVVAKLKELRGDVKPVSYTHLRAHETPEHLVCRLLLEKKKNKNYYDTYR
eukprot:TRINITY_DN13629_c0_g1_i1.p1 TRINITY_DN13629_c0_g1~~TRINITY_DN13629_c0_g1_i1.p1  ORF type:complete len:165 (-),score=62.06 TRINITY_DN13629_c0_g1_i1:23-517(-)